jgi:enoyl-CoA hydratase/carnithine racemase
LESESAGSGNQLMVTAAKQAFGGLVELEASTTSTGCTVCTLRMLKSSFCQTLVDDLNAALDSISITSNFVLVTTGIGKYYHLGFDLEYLAKNKDTSHTFINQSYASLLKRLIELPCPTIALINGHVYAAGLVFACVHDYRVLANETTKVSWMPFNHQFCFA